MCSPAEPSDFRPVLTSGRVILQGEFGNLWRGLRFHDFRGAFLPPQEVAGGEVEAPGAFNTLPDTNQPLVGNDPPIPGGEALSLAGHLTLQVSEIYQNKNV